MDLHGVNPRATVRSFPGPENLEPRLLPLPAAPRPEGKVRWGSGGGVAFGGCAAVPTVFCGGSVAARLAGVVWSLGSAGRARRGHTTWDAALAEVPRPHGRPGAGMRRAHVCLAAHHALLQPATWRSGNLADPALSSIGNDEVQSRSCSSGMVTLASPRLHPSSCIREMDVFVGPCPMALMQDNCL